MGSKGKVFALMLVVAIVALSVMLPPAKGQASSSTPDATLSPTMPVLAPNPTPLGVVSGLIAATVITVLLIYMLKRMKDKHPILGL